MSENCCICLEDGKSACRLSEMDQTGRSYQNKLEKIAVEILWSGDYYICTECIEVLNMVEEFVDKCYESDALRSKKLTDETKSDIPKSIDDCINELLSENDDGVLNDTYDDPKQSDADSESETEMFPIEKVFQCEVCSDTFEDLKTYLGHCNDVHKILARNVKPYLCKICKSRFAQKANYTKHLQYHSDNNESEVQIDSDLSCKICERSFSNGRNLKRHMLNKHPSETDARPRFCCMHCQQNFTSKWNLHRHIKRCQPNSLRKKKIMKCMLCDYYQDTRENVVAHYANTHDVQIVCKKLSFENYQQFEAWKDQVERETVSKYVKGSFYKSNGKSTHYYRCHRDGFYKHAGRNIRRLKQSGSNKIDGVCPAKMQASFVTENGEVQVEYIETHVGHSMDLKRIPLRKADRNFLAEQLSMNVSFDDLINNVRHNIGVNNFDRIQLLTKKDLFNIEQMYNLNKDPERHSDPNRRYQCPQCGKEYKILKMMRSHIAKVHHQNAGETVAREKKHFCHACPKSYYSEAQLQKHLQVHVEANPSSCLICDEKFPDKEGTKLHMKEMHNVAFDIKYEHL